MIHGYHVVMTMYGFWLPNNPRGSWSDFVRKWELARFGDATQNIERKNNTELTESQITRHEHAKQKLKYPPVSIDGVQALAIANGFARQAEKSNYTIWACSVLPDHAHLVIARHRYKVEQVVNLLKGSSTSNVLAEEVHPLKNYAQPGKRPPRMWSSRHWKVFLDSETAIDEAIHYVEQNPVKEGKPLQHWSFVRPFHGIARGAWVTYR